MPYQILHNCKHKFSVIEKGRNVLWLELEQITLIKIENIALWVLWRNFFISVYFKI